MGQILDFPCLVWKCSFFERLQGFKAFLYTETTVSIQTELKCFEQVGSYKELMEYHGPS